ncbi:MAG: alpha/beta fold hydrolase [Pseudoclavibacter sp.]
MTATTASAHYPELHPPTAPAAAPSAPDALGASGTAPVPAPDTAPLVLLHGGNVANWMWQPQVDAFGDRTVITPHLPGFGARVDEPWPGLGAAADDLVARLRSLGVDGPFHVAGLSLGGVVALHLHARHPSLVRSTLATGAALERVGASTRLAAKLQLRFWDAPWFWRAQAASFGLPQDSRELYVEHGLTIRSETAAAMLAEAYEGGVPTGLGDATAPLLAIAGEREPAVIRRSVERIGQVQPAAHLRIAPKMHHIWNIEDVDLFNGTLRAWLGGGVDERLAPLRTARR